MTTLRRAHDEFFNENVAKKAYDMVMAMDTEDAIEFSKHVAYGMLQQDIEANRKTIDRHVRDVSKRLINHTAQAVRKGLLPVEVYEEVSKALTPVIKSWDESGVKRDRSGQFSTTESRIRTRPGAKAMPKKQERESGIPSAFKLAGANADGGHRMSPRERAAYQQQYLQLVDVLDRYDSAGINSDKAKLVLENKQTGARFSSPAVTNGTVGGGWDASRFNLVGVRADATTGQRASAAAFDVVNAIGSTPANAERSGFAEQWNNASNDTPGTNERTYRRVQAGAELVNQLNRDPITGAPINTKLAAASGLASLAGQYGPQAEQVLGPHARKTAYRYRGTERKPDAALLKMQEGALNRASVPERDMSPAQLIAFRAGKSPLSSEEKQNTSALAAQQYLFDRRPDPSLSEIHRKSGKIPPSEGVLIGADGEIKHQSVGFSDDHYLPFNLKNLKDLKGGQYVRTRTSGGLTTEDIYTGLVSGARSVTVVSNSGIFTVDFADDLRGGRRMSDKAASMVGQYGKTLDAIKEGKIEREPLSADVRAQILSDVNDEYAGLPREEIQQAYEQRVKAYREIPVLSERELQAIDAKVASEYPEGGRSAQSMRLELQEAALETRQDRHYKLDGEGYAAASRALKEQFPYFIGSVSFQTKNSRKSWDTDKPSDQSPEMARRLKNTSDTGYVKPRHNRPEAALSGYYDQSIAGEGGVKGSGKTKASETNYQNWEHNPQRRSRPQAKGAQQATQETASEGGSQQQKAQPVDAKSMRAKIEEADIIRTQQKKAVGEMKIAVGSIETEGLKKAAPELAEALEGGFEEAMRDPNRSSTLIRQMTTLSADNTGYGRSLKAALERYNGATAGTNWGEQSLGRTSKEGYRFEGPAYGASASPEVRNAEIRKLERETPGLSSAYSDEKLANLSVAAGRLSLAFKGNDQDALLNAATEYADAMEAPRATDFTRRILEGDAGKRAELYAKTAENAERLRSLKLNLPQPKTEDAQAEPAQQKRDSSKATTTATKNKREYLTAIEHIDSEYGGKDNSLGFSDGDKRAIASVRYLLSQGSKQDALNVMKEQEMDLDMRFDMLSDLVHGIED